MRHEVRVSLQVGQMFRNVLTGNEIDGLGPAGQTEYAISGIVIAKGEYRAADESLDLWLLVSTERQAGANAGTGTVRRRLIRELATCEYLAVYP